MASNYSNTVLLICGVLLLVHAFYVTYTMREELQSHHSRSGFTSSPAGIGKIAAAIPAVANAAAAAASGGKNGAAAPAKAAWLAIPWWVAFEVIAGIVISMYSFTSSSDFTPARLIDTVEKERYDAFLYTGVGFVHFQHRGTVARLADAAPASAKLRTTRGILNSGRANQGGASSPSSSSSSPQTGTPSPHASNAAAGAHSKKSQ